jgi:hypothetical protein
VIAASTNERDLHGREHTQLRERHLDLDFDGAAAR